VATPAAPRSAYRQALVVGTASSEEQLALAAQTLDRCEGIVMLQDVARLRPQLEVIQCEVIDPAPGAHRCAEEFRVLIENAGRALAASRLASRLPRRPLRWLVVSDSAMGTEQLWPPAS
jgi:hypothetical protein